MADERQKLSSPRFGAQWRSVVLGGVETVSSQNPLLE